MATKNKVKGDTITVLVNGQPQESTKKDYIARKTIELVQEGYDEMDEATVEYELERVLDGNVDDVIAKSIKKDLA